MATRLRRKLDISFHIFRLDPTDTAPMKSLAKTMQIAGLTMLPLACYLEMTVNLPRRLPIAQMVIMVVFGVCLFALGRYLDCLATRSL